MKLSTPGKRGDMLGSQFSVFFGLISVVMGILLGAAFQLMSRVTLRPREIPTLSRMATWLKQRTVLNLWRSEP
jgi:hypothetical protein